VSLEPSQIANGGPLSEHNIRQGNHDAAMRRIASATGARRV
jgi:hypothetical protein